VSLTSPVRFSLPCVPAVGFPHILTLTQRQQGPVKSGRSANLHCVMPRNISLLWLERVGGDSGICTLTDASGFPPVFMRVYRSADKSLARPERKKATATEDFDVRVSYEYLLS